MLRNITEVVVIWFLPAGLALLDTTNIVRPHVTVELVLCTIAAALTLRLFVRRYIADAAAHAPVVEALEHGYELAHQHCREHQVVGRHRAAVGETTDRRKPILSLVNSRGGVLTYHPVGDTETAPDASVPPRVGPTPSQPPAPVPLAPRRADRPAPRPR